MAKKSVKEILQKDNPEFTDTVEALSVEDLNAMLAKIAKQSEEVQQALDLASEEGGPIHAARQALKELTGPYTDAKKLFNLKTRYVVQLIEEKGGA